MHAGLEPGLDEKSKRLSCNDFFVFDDFHPGVVRPGRQPRKVVSHRFGRAAGVIHAARKDFLAGGRHHAEGGIDGNFRGIGKGHPQGSVATFHDFAAGPSEHTKNPLDIAIDGKAFLTVQTAAGERYTRDGGLHINNQGQLVTASGDPVLGTSGPIVFQPTDKSINIAADGNITVVEGTATTDSVRGKLRLVSFADPQKLVKEGGNLYSAGQGIVPQPDTTSRVNQGYIEKSNVNSVHEMSRLIEITRTYTKISAMLQQQHDLHRTAVEKLADVPA